MREGFARLASMLTPDTLYTPLFRSPSGYASGPLPAANASFDAGPPADVPSTGLNRDGAAFGFICRGALAEVGTSYGMADSKAKPVRTLAQHTKKFRSPVRAEYFCALLSARPYDRPSMPMCQIKPKGPVSLRCCATEQGEGIPVYPRSFPFLFLPSVKNSYS